MRRTYGDHKVKFLCPSMSLLMTGHQLGIPKSDAAE